MNIHFSKLELLFFAVWYFAGSTIAISLAATYYLIKFSIWFMSLPGKKAEAQESEPAPQDELAQLISQLEQAQ